jgi:transcriptional regulator of acetoin/glycerol metabolism
MPPSDAPTRTVAPAALRVRAVTVRVIRGPDKLRDVESKNGTFMGVSRVHEVTLTGDAAVLIGGTTLGITISTDAEGIDLPLSVRNGFGEAVGHSTIMRHLFATLESAAATDLTVLLEGESGVGKDLLARAIHARSARAAGPLVVADCSAMPESLIESELFGHERGAFTGPIRPVEAYSRRRTAERSFSTRSGSPRSICSRRSSASSSSGRSGRSVGVRLARSTCG